MSAPFPHCEACGKRLDLCDCPEKDEHDADYLNLTTVTIA